MPIRLLITARDVAAALHLVQVARAGSHDPRFHVHVAAQVPAAQHFASAGIPVRTLALPTVTTASAPEAAALRAAARDLLADIRPDAVLVGLSTPFDAGLDEAVLAEAAVPTTLFQDFWGEQNLILGRGADRILAIDAQAAERNLERYNIHSTVVGSPRHAAYAELDIAGVRSRVRSAIGCGPHGRVIGFFGQALHALPGYRRTVQQFVSCMKTLADPVTLVLRPHPRENAGQRLETEALFRDAGLAATLFSEGPVEEALVACDVVVSLFSICTFDTAYLNRFSPAPIAVPMSLLFDREIAAYCRQHGNYFDFAHHTLGLVKPVYQVEDLLPALQAALLPATVREVWERAHHYLPDPASAATSVLDEISRQSIAGRGTDVRG